MNCIFNINKIICCFGFIILSINATAQIEKIDTDRPDQTESPAIVPKKWMQFEMGFLKETAKQYGEVFFQHPSLLTKYGVSDRFELRLITEWGTLNEDAVNRKLSTTAVSGVQLGGKYNFCAEKGLRPKTSLIAHYDFGNFRTRIFRDTINGANFRFTLQHTLSQLVSLSYNIGMEWNRFGSPAAYIYTLSPGFNISDKWYGYVEVFGFISFDRASQNSVDGGIAYYITDNFKIDGSAGFGLSKDAPDNYFAVGASFRFKTCNK